MTLSQCNVLNGVHILVIDDDPDSLELTTFVLTTVGAVVTAVDCVAAAQTRFLAHPPQLVVSDLAMPGVTGYDFIAWVRALSPANGGQVPVLALTALASPSDRQAALQAGFNAYLSKPFNVDQLPAVLTQLLQTAAVTVLGSSVTVNRPGGDQLPPSLSSPSPKTGRT